MNTEIPVSSFSFKWGIILGAINIGYYLFVQFAGLTGSNVAGYADIIFMITVLAMAMREYRMHNLGFMSMGKALNLGIYLIFIAGLAMSVFLYIYLTYIDASPMQAAIELAKEAIQTQLNSNPNISDEELEQINNFQEMLLQPWYFALSSLIGNLFVGLLFTVLAGIIYKRKPEDQIPL